MLFPSGKSATETKDLIHEGIATRRGASRCRLGCSETKDLIHEGIATFFGQLLCPSQEFRETKDLIHEGIARVNVFAILTLVVVPGVCMIWMMTR